MDRFSFLNSAHTAYFAELYDQYLQNPDAVEPSWRAFFQGFDFGMEHGEWPAEVAEVEVPESVKKEFHAKKSFSEILADCNMRRLWKRSRAIGDHRRWFR